MNRQVLYGLVRFVYIIVRDRLWGVLDRDLSFYVRHGVLLNNDILLNF